MRVEANGELGKGKQEPTVAPKAPIKGNFTAA